MSWLSLLLIGEVTYTADGFCKANTDRLSSDIIELLLTSANKLIQVLFKNDFELFRQDKEIVKHGTFMCVFYQE